MNKDKNKIKNCKNKKIYTIDEIEVHFPFDLTNIIMLYMYDDTNFKKIIFVDSNEKRIYQILNGKLCDQELCDNDNSCEIDILNYYFSFLFN